MKSLITIVFALLSAACVSRPPTISHVHVGHALTGVQVTPGQKGYMEVAEDRAHEAVDDLGKAHADADLATLKTDVGNAVHASTSEADFGLQHAVTMASNHLSFAATSDDASPNVQKFAPQFATDISRLVERCELIALLGRDVQATGTLHEAQILTIEMEALARANLEGDDSNHDGKVGSVSSEYGILQLRAELNEMVEREKPHYVTVKRWYLFNLVRLPNGRWVFDKYSRGGNLDGYK